HFQVRSLTARSCSASSRSLGGRNPPPWWTERSEHPEPDHQRSMGARSPSVYKAAEDLRSEFFPVTQFVQCARTFRGWPFRPCFSRPLQGGDDSASVPG